MKMLCSSRVLARHHVVPSSDCGCTVGAGRQGRVRGRARSFERSFARSAEPQREAEAQAAGDASSPGASLGASSSASPASPLSTSSSSPGVEQEGPKGHFLAAASVGFGVALVRFPRVSPLTLGCRARSRSPSSHAHAYVSFLRDVIFSSSS